MSDELLKQADEFCGVHEEWTLVKDLAARVRELEAERDEYMLDAERYRWLRDGDGPESARWSRWRIEHWASPWRTWSDIRNADLDAAIDQARDAAETRAAFDQILDQARKG